MHLSFLRTRVHQEAQAGFVLRQGVPARPLRDFYDAMACPTTRTYRRLEG
jgi:hypothetical protein